VACTGCAGHRGIAQHASSVVVLLRPTGCKLQSHGCLCAAWQPSCSMFALISKLRRHFRHCRWTLVCQLSSCFNAFCLVRTLSNSIEATCTAIGVCLWMESRQAAMRGQLLHARRLRRAAVAAAGVGAVMRPSSAAFWAPLGDRGRSLRVSWVGTASPSRISRIVQGCSLTNGSTVCGSAGQLGFAVCCNAQAC